MLTAKLVDNGFPWDHLAETSNRRILVFSGVEPGTRDQGPPMLPKYERFFQSLHSGTRPRTRTPIQGTGFCDLYSPNFKKHVADPVWTLPGRTFCLWVQDLLWFPLSRPGRGSVPSHPARFPSPLTRLGSRPPLTRLGSRPPLTRFPSPLTRLGSRPLSPGSVAVPLSPGSVPVPLSPGSVPVPSHPARFPSPYHPARRKEREAPRCVL